MSVIKKPYEISLWEDVLTFKYNKDGEVVAQYYDEQKICVIGSDTMDTPIRATQPKLVSKINGENILTFNMYSHYYDEETEQYLKNPYIGYLINERKVKLRYGNPGSSAKWYDFVIKNIQENSDTKTYTYTAKDLFVNELSKSGFDLVFDAELENNTGNVELLASRILEGSDWELKPSGKILKQFVEEPLYVIKLKNTIIAKNLENENEELTLAEGSIIYGFYYNITNQMPFFQFLYSEEQEPPIDEDNYIVGSPNWFLDGVTYSDGKPDFATSMAISDKYRGRRLVRKMATKYDSTIDKYVNIYSYENKEGKKEEVYGFTETEYISPTTVQSYVTNGTNYESTTGWELCGIKNSQGQVLFPKLEVATVPDITTINPEKIDDVDFTSCLKFQASGGQYICNSGIMDYRNQIGEITEGEQYVFRAKFGMATDIAPNELTSPRCNLDFIVTEYSDKEGIYTWKDSDKIFEGELDLKRKFDYGHIIVNSKRSLSQKDLAEKKIGLFLSLSNKLSTLVYLVDVQLFPCVGTEDNFILPDSTDIETQVKTKYYYYKPDLDYKSREEVQFLYQGYEAQTQYTEIYQNGGYEKIRSIKASESNRFNLIQELSEIFECWPKFEIVHDQDTGKIQKKCISFHEYITNENHSGFKYRVNLKSIQRTVESEAIVSKLIVKNNSNEFAVDKFCSIARSSENPSGENFILDFSYYIQKNLIGMNEVTNDLYSDYNGYLGYYKKLREINSERDKYIQKQAGLLKDISEYEAQLKVYSVALDEARKQEANKLVEVRNLTGQPFEYLTTTEGRKNKWWEQKEFISLANTITRLKTFIKNYEKLKKAVDNNLSESREEEKKINQILSSKKKSEDGDRRLLLEKQELHRLFYKKYSRFLQEGSWISEDYVDDNLYYLDAQSTLFTSAKPKISYNISVLELSQLEGYENYSFSLGDKTTIEDTEFFGWKDDGITPYQEEIVVTELTINLDSPELNKIKVQNYKTQFEDLFQRIVATTQAVEYSTGKYNKVANVVKEDGTINIQTLQNSITNNALTLQNAKDQTVIWDDTGITTTSAKDPANVVRIVNGGIFLSRDGGLNWRTGITGEGISADYITSGHINTDTISILANNMPTFKWDRNGLSAYAYELKDNIPINFNYMKYVRFDQFGLYGINSNSDFNPLAADENGKVGIAKIFENADFALTWEGFSLRTKKDGHSGYVRITKEDDISLVNVNANGEEITQVKIGVISGSGENPIYGIQLRDMENKVSLEQGSDGKVWIRDALKVGESNSSTVSIGYIEDDINDNNAHAVIKAGDKETTFVVYEDGTFHAVGGYFEGKIKATSGSFTGRIDATEGSIGGMDISSIVSGIYEVSIEATDGIIFKNEGEKELTAKLYQRGEEVTNKVIAYQWYKDREIMIGETNQTLIVSSKDFEETIEYVCEITVQESVE